MNLLITGIGGFVGRHLAAECRAAGHDVFGLDRVPATVPEARKILLGDLCDTDTLKRILDDVRPDACVHLAGLASVPACAADPGAAFRINVLGTLALWDAFREAGRPMRLLFVSTAHVYGSAEGVLDETAPLRPDSLYALSKATAEQSLLLAARDSAVSALSVRPVNHIGPGQSPDYVVAGFAAQLAAMEAGGAEPVLRTGNLESERDFLDVRDVVRAYRLLLERGEPGQIYNLASSQPVTIRHLLERLVALSGQTPRIETDPARFRPTDRSPTLNTARIRRDTGWTPAIRLDQTLRDLYAAARATPPKH